MTKQAQAQELPKSRLIKIKEAMGREGHSKVKLAKLLGVTRETVARKLNGASPWKIAELERLAEIYKVDKGFFL